MLFRDGTLVGGVDYVAQLMEKLLRQGEPDHPGGWLHPYVGALESSQTNRNMLRGLWFDQDVAVSLRGKDGASYQIKGKPARYVITGPLYKQFFLAMRERMGPDGDIAGVWVITPEEVKNESFSVRKQEEEEKHPYFRHFDRLRKEG